MADDDPKTIEEEFDEAVNMTPKELEDWLETDESKSVGQKDGNGESVGHDSGRRIVPSSARAARTTPTRTTNTCARSWATSTDI